MVSNITHLQVCVDLDSSMVDMYRGIGSVLPAAPSYDGATDPVLDNNTGLAFAGGLAPTHLDVSYPKGQASQGLRRNYTLLQQGLTKNVTCSTVTADNSNSSSSFNPIPVPLADGTTDYWLWAWNVTGNCTQGRCAKFLSVKCEILMTFKVDSPNSNM